MTEAEPQRKKKSRMGRPPQVENARSYILKISAQFFAANGYERSTISQLAQGMKMSKAFIYHYFSSKEQIIDEIALDTYERLRQSSATTVAAGSSPVEKIRLFMLAHAQFLQDNYYEMRTIDYTSVGRTSKDVGMVVRQADTDYRTSLVNIFEEGIKQGSILSTDPALSARVVFSVVHSISRWYKPETDPNPAVHYAEKFFRILAEGFETRQLADCQSSA